ncbi:hypothetical protein ABZP36_020729 [Zizania latifolia]
MLKLLIVDNIEHIKDATMLLHRGLDMAMEKAMVVWVVVSLQWVHRKLIMMLSLCCIVELNTNDIMVEERLVSVDELLEADEVFCTGTDVVVSPVVSITYQGKRAPKLNCEDVISPVEIIHPPEDYNLNSSLSFTLQRKCVDDEQLLERKKVQLEDAKKTSVDNNRGTLSDTNELEQVLVDIEKKELVLQKTNQKTNVRLTKALQDEHDRRACYKDFIDSVYSEVGSNNVLDHGIELVKEKLHYAEQVCHFS